MANERNGTKAEQLSWEQQLSASVDEQVEKLQRSGVKPTKRWESAFGLEAPDGTKIRLAALPTLDHPRVYVPARVAWMDLGAGDFPLVPGTSGRPYERTVYSQNRDDFPLEFMVDTRAPLRSLGRSAHAVASSGDITSLATEGHYEAFAEPYGTRVYKLGEDEQLQPVDPTEGGRLIWLISNGEPVNDQ